MNGIHILTYVALALVFILGIVSIYLKNIATKLEAELSKISGQPIDQSTIAFEKNLLRGAIDHALMRALYYYGTIDIKFDDENSPVKELFKGHYRDLITYLLRQDIVINVDDNCEQRLVPFFNIFINKVYLHYTAETPETIKRLFFKYFSGYSVDSYFDKVRGKPSEIPYLTDYVQNFLWNQFDAIEHDQKKIMERPEVASFKVKFEDLLSRYDYDCLRKIYLNIYNDNGDIDPIMSSPGLTKPENNVKEKEKKNEFSVDFHEQSK